MSTGGVEGADGADGAEVSDAAASADAPAARAVLAAALVVIDPQGLGGVAVRAQAGPVRDSWLASLRALLPPGMPLVRMPHHISDDRLLGGLDLGATLAAGRPVAQVGLLAAADGGLLQIHMAERLSGSTAALVCAALDRGELQLERDGLSSVHSARMGVIALDEALPEDTPLSPALADRLGLVLDLSGHSLREALPLQGGEQQAVAAARHLLPAVQVDAGTLQALCATALALGVHSGRAALWSLRATRAAAALRGRRLATAEDAAVAVQLVLAPRATQRPVHATEDEETVAESPPPPPAPPPPPDKPDNEAAATPEPPQPPPSNIQTLEDQLVAAATAAMPPGLLGLLARLAHGDSVRTAPPAAGRAGAAVASRQRGRPLGAQPGMPHAGARLHLLATLRAAAPWQRLRQSAAAVSQLPQAVPQVLQPSAPAPAARPKGPSRPPSQPSAASAVSPVVPTIRVRSSDFHIRRFEQRRCTTTVFAIDASGSSALHRLAEAKGAVELLLAECYVRRDEVAVLSFRGRSAELLLPPTRSLVRAKRSLAGLPGGGGTPLAAGIAAAAALADQVRRKGATPVVVLLTDGRANVAMNGEGGRVQAQQDALTAARALRAQRGHVLLIDTSARPEPAAVTLALALGARYLPLPQANSTTLSRAVAGRG